MSKKSIAIDMDDVMTDAAGRFIEIYRQEYNDDLSDLRLPGRNLDNTVPPERLAAVKQFPHRHDFFKDMDIKEDCREVVEKLQQQYEVYIVTAAMEFEHCLNHKYNWLKNHLPFIPWTNIVFCGNKSIISTDYLIDDLERNLKSFSGTPLVFTAGHNTHLTDYTRFDNWLEVAGYFLK